VIPNGPSPKNHKGVEAFMQLSSKAPTGRIIFSHQSSNNSSPIRGARICRPTLWNNLNQKSPAKTQERRRWFMVSSS